MDAWNKTVKKNATYRRVNVLIIRICLTRFVLADWHYFFYFKYPMFRIRWRDAIQVRAIVLHVADWKEAKCALVDRATIVALGNDKERRVVSRLWLPNGIFSND